MSSTSKEDWKLCPDALAQRVSQRETHSGDNFVSNQIFLSFLRHLIQSFLDSLDSMKVRSIDCDFFFISDRFLKRKTSQNMRKMRSHSKALSRIFGASYSLKNSSSKNCPKFVFFPQSHSVER